MREDRKIEVLSNAGVIAIGVEAGLSTAFYPYET